MANELKKYILSAHIVLMVLLFSACNGKSKTSFMQEGGDTLNLRYAENLQIVKYQHYTQVTLRNPWDTLKTLHTYLLVNKQDSCPSSLPEGTIVRVPLSNSLIFSSVHCGLLQELGALDKIKGVWDLQYIRNHHCFRKVKARYRRDACLSLSLCPDSYCSPHRLFLFSDNFPI